MKRIGFIGTGSMGTILIESFLEAHAITPDSLTITNRTKEKALSLASSHKGINVANNAREVANECDWIFLCVKPPQMLPVVEEVQDLLTNKKTLISITSPLLVEELEMQSDAQAVRFVPSIVNRALEGPSLVTFSKRVTEENKQELMKLFTSISRPEMIKDSITRVASDFASCGPAFISYLVQSMIKGAVEETEITEEEATNIAEAMLIGYGELLKKKHFTLQTLQKRVTVPGGVTGEGLKVLRNEVGNQFNLLFQATHAKFHEDREIIQKQLKEKSKE